jgi:hypothetical protein
MGRTSVAGLLGFVAVFAIGLAALVNATDVWVGVAFTLMFGLLLASVLALILPGGRRGGWLGFALFGWASFLVGSIPALGLDSNSCLLPDAVAEWIFERSNPKPVPPPNWSPALTSFGGLGGMAPQGSPPMTQEGYAYIAATNDRDSRSSNARNIGRWLAVLLFAGAGASFSVLLARWRRARDVATAPVNGRDSDGSSTAVSHAS